MTDQPSTLPTHFALVVFPQFQVLDAFGPTEVLHGIGHPLVNPQNASNIRLSIVGPSLDPVSTGPAEGDPSPLKSRIAQTVVPTHTFDDPPQDVDVLIVPGGFEAGPKALWGAVCNGAGLAARAGILDGHRATTNKQMWSAIVPCGPKTHWVAKARWVVADDNKLWTSSGVSAGTEAMLALIDHIYGKNEQGVLFGDVIGGIMEWNRVKDSETDPFAVSNEVEDVEPQ